jgi:endonuclease YncB( thermonuclease family)
VRLAHVLLAHLLAHVLLVAALTQPARAAELIGTIVRVADGDTVTVLAPGNAQHRIRLAGIDAPERGQPYGERAKQHLAALVFHRSVRIEWTKRDRYNRIVGRVLVPCAPAAQCPTPIDAGLEQIRAGLAWHYKQYEREQTPAERALYAEAENAARVRRAGLWNEPQPVAPWTFRSASISARNAHHGGE